MGDMIWNITGGLCEDIDDLMFINEILKMEEEDDDND